MIRSRPALRSAFVALAAVTLCAAGALAQEGGPPEGSPPTPPRGSEREAMWPAPTDEDWARPCLITFQRTWEDALAVAKETGRPLLLCINMDGEIASEHYAGVRYRQPEIAKLYEPYVAVIASVYRHNPQDHDEAGRRILCPRFGSVTCGEHIAIEPILYEKFLDGRRIAPRHIMVELDGKETYDVFYANDTASVFKAIDDGITTRPGGVPPPVVRGDRPATERVGSRDVTDRAAVERAYAEGSKEQRSALLDAAIANQAANPVEILRQAILGLDVDLAQKARTALAASEDPASTDLIVEALRIPLPAGEHDALLAALERIGATSRRARWMAVVHRGLATGSSSVDAAAWTEALAKVDRGAAAVYERSATSGRHGDAADAAKLHPEDAAARVDLAEASLDLAIHGAGEEADPRVRRTFRGLLLHDARAAALEAEKLGAQDWRTNAVLALADYYGGNTDDAYSRAETAVKEMPPGQASWTSMAILTVFAESRFKAIKAAVKDKTDWPPEWLTDLHAAYTALLPHPLATDAQVLWHYDFLDWLRADDRAADYLRAGVERFPGSAALHQRLRMKVIRTRGPAALLSAYDALLASAEADSDMPWFAAYATVVAGDFYRRGRRAEKALECYDRAIELYGRAAAARPEDADSCEKEITLILAGRARVSMEQGDLEGALQSILASYERGPAHAGTRDGIGITPGETGQMLVLKLEEAGKGDLATELRTAMGKLDPELLAPDRP